MRRLVQGTLAKRHRRGVYEGRCGISGDGEGAECRRERWQKFSLVMSRSSGRWRQGPCRRVSTSTGLSANATEFQVRLLSDGGACDYRCEL